MKLNVSSDMHRRAGHDAAPGVAAFAYALAACYPAIRSLWLIGGHAADGGETAAPPWELMAFANRHTLIGLKSSTGLHRPDVRLSVVTDGDRFEPVWGDDRHAGSLAQRDWVEANGSEAFYSEAARHSTVPEATVHRMRRKAVCVWRSVATPP